MKIKNDMDNDYGQEHLTHAATSQIPQHDIPWYKQLFFWNRYTAADMQPERETLNSFTSKREKAKKAHRRKLIAVTCIILMSSGTLVGLVFHIANGRNMGTQTAPASSTLASSSNDAAAKQILKGKAVDVKDDKDAQDKQKKAIKDAVTKQQKDDQKQIDKLKSANKKITKQNNDLQGQVKDLTGDNNDLTKKAQKLNSQINDLKSQASDSSDDQKTINNLRSQINKLKNQLATQNSHN